MCSSLPIRDEDDEEFDIPPRNGNGFRPKSFSFEVIDDPEAFLRLRVEDHFINFAPEPVGIVIHFETSETDRQIAEADRDRDIKKCRSLDREEGQ